MDSFSKYFILSINSMIIIWLAKINYFDTDSDVLGIIDLMAIISLILFNIYSIFLYRFISKKVINSNLRKAFYAALLFFSYCINLGINFLTVNNKFSFSVFQ